MDSEDMALDFLAGHDNKGGVGTWSPPPIPADMTLAKSAMLNIIKEQNTWVF